ncbi:hypothetical protein GZ77_01435 [Endozoicomonas montiporae]|uniref:Uncharacterized protein n=2 Tax=Endozoicomonas montiporae TaxID=1027273 RepID=A0A081NA71_9GAMM|nr:hypothetical protein EZMO1_2935 [Endozoicomonas montiporae CL-33]KEQ15344.1 hypothetical protein GZ77_01435 [Endozoicomonas montiporae]
MNNESLFSETTKPGSSLQLPQKLSTFEQTETDFSSHQLPVSCHFAGRSISIRLAQFKYTLQQDPFDHAANAKALFDRLIYQKEQNN